jgi:sulfate/thiosulfate transport system permease protein
MSRTLRFSRRRSRVLPGFGLTLGFTVAYLALIVVVPLAGLVAEAGTLPWHAAAAALADPRTLAAFRVSFGIALAAALVNLPIGLLLAWTLTRYHFPGRQVLDALVDLPFALPTAVAGIALTTLYVEQGWIGAVLARLGIVVAFNPAGIGVALAFVGLPFVVRTIQPVLAGLEREAEEAALTLGARPWHVFRRVILPPLVPAALTGAAMAFARGVGEYGSVIFIAGNRPAVSEIVPLLIVTKLEQFDYPGAAVLGTAMLALSLTLLLAVNALQRWTVAGQEPLHAG